MVLQSTLLTVKLIVISITPRYTAGEAPMPSHRFARRFALAATVIGALALSGLATIDSVAPEAASAAAGDGITAYLSPPFVQGPGAGIGATIEDFNSYTNNTNPCGSSVVRGVATLTGNCTITNGELTTPLEGQWGGANTSSSTPTVGGTASMFATPRSGGLTVTFSTPVQYFGFWWSAGGAGDTVSIYSPSNALLATFDSTTLNGLLVTNASTSDGTGAGSANPPTQASYPGDFFLTAINGNQYRKGHYFGRPKDHTSLNPTVLPIRDINRNQYSHTYLNIFTSGTVAIGKVVFPNRQSFEFDNLAWATGQQTPSSELVFLQSVSGKSVEFRANGGSGSMVPQTSDATTTLTPNTFTRAGYTFNGWHTTSSGTGGTSYTDQAPYGFTSDTVLHAQWTPNTLAVTYDTQGGSAISAGSTSTDGSISTDPGTPARDGYTFNGWFTAATGGTAISFPHAHGQTANFTLYAQWTAVVAPGSSTTTTTATSRSTTVEAATTPTTATTPATTTTTVTAPKVAAASRTKDLPTTGTNAWLLASFGLLIATAGLSMLRRQRRC
jgi:uncharacterized repeat protein (TIGR02543 family)/LPXTG-motif cell wall-anchored protein